MRERERDIKKMAVAEKGRVCVTGAGGFVASWVVKYLLSDHYTVHGTVRQPNDEKNAHLQKLEKESDSKLKLVKADLLDYDSILSAIDGCVGVFHVASPVPSTTSLNPEVEVLEPAVKGTQNVLKACLEAKVKRLVYVSSGAAVCLNPEWPKHQPMDETCWSDQDYCRITKNWYCLSKTQAESKVFEFSRETGLDVVSVCPTLILGPIFQSHVVNASTLVLLKLLKGGDDTVENQFMSIVDVRDVVKALVMAYEKPEAQGRYICVAHQIEKKDLVGKLKTIYPHYIYPSRFSEVEVKMVLSSEKLQRLGWTYRPLEETLIDSIQSYRTAGLVD